MGALAMESNLGETAKATATEKPRSRQIIFGLVIVALAGSAAWFGTGGLRASAPTPNTAIAEPAPQIVQLSALDVMTVQPTTAEDIVKATGQVFPVQEAAVSAQVNGLAESVTVRPGDEVEKGDLLASIGPTDLQLQLDQQRNTVEATRAQLASAVANLGRTQSLADKGLTSQTDLDAAKSEVDRLTATFATQQSQVQSAILNVERAQIAAPFAGIVASRTIEPGQIVSSGTPIFTIVDMSKVRVELLIALRDAARISTGQTVNLWVQGAAGRTFVGVIDRINPIAETGTRSVKAYVSLDNPEQLLRGGMITNASIIVDRQEAAMLLPKTALLSDDTTTYVRVVSDGHIEDRPVSAGKSWGTELVQITSGVASGDVVVRNDLSGLAADTRVSVEGN